MKRVAFYISCHGLGHAMRMKELIARLLDEEPKADIFVMGAMPPWVFEEPPRLPITHRRLLCDIGAVQKDSLHLDVEETLRRNAEFYERIDDLVQSEAAFLRRQRIDLVVGDIPPLAFLAAAAAGVRSVAVGNFSWDWIYEEYVRERPNYGFLIDIARDAYAKADFLLRLPFHGDMGAFRSIRDIPLISRKATLPREEVRRRLGIPPGEKRKVVFISMGGHSFSELDADSTADFGDCIFISFFRLSRRMRHLVLAEDRAGIPHPDIVRASDLVISKPGYCTVAECIGNRTPLMYTSRDNFREFPVMEAGVRRYCDSYRLPRRDFHAGRWKKHLDAFFSRSMPFRWPEIGTDGAEIAAHILKTY